MEETNQVVETTQTFQEVLDSNKDYQAEFDKRNAKSIETAIANARTKWEQEAEEKRTEAEKLSKMKADEKIQYEMENLTKAKNESESKLNAYLLKDQARNIARAEETKIDETLLDLIDFTTIKAEDVDSRIKTIKEAFDKAVERRVNEQLKETTPKSVLVSGEVHKEISRSSI